GNAMAIVTGLAPKSRHAPITKVLSTEFHASPYMEKYVEEALFQMNEPDLAFKRMKRQYGDMIASEHSTLWEGWVRKFSGTINHGWSGGPLSNLMQYAAGISRSTEDPSLVYIHPRPGKLKHIECSVPMKNGLMEFRMSLEKTYRYSITVPQGMRLSLQVISRPKSITALHTNDTSSSVTKRNDREFDIHLKEGNWEIQL
ncbi:MAG: hypothetical protein EOO88_43440, partial [Pedobacter sp.]